MNNTPQMIKQTTIQIGKTLNHRRPTRADLIAFFETDTRNLKIQFIGETSANSVCLPACSPVD